MAGRSCVGCDRDQAARLPIGSRWHVDETYLNVAGRWRYVDRAVDQAGQVIDVPMSARRDAKAVPEGATADVHSSRVMLFGVGSERCSAAVDWHDGAGDEARVVGEQVGYGSCDLLRAS